MKLGRDPAQARQHVYDLIVIGGGVYGVMLTLEAARRDLSVLLLEKEDFGGATSFNSLRIVHGGLRDLQTFDLWRYWAFGRERKWFLQQFPEWVEPLPVLVPLYQRGLMRTQTFRMALGLDRVLLPARYRKVRGERVIPPGRLLSPEEVRRQFQAVRADGLSGGGLWYDAAVPNSQRLLIDALRRASALGATALNYMPAVGVLEEAGRIKGVRARDDVAQEQYEFASEIVVNAAGPWTETLARDLDVEPFDRAQYALAWNILFDREAPSDCAVGVRPPVAGAPFYFLHPWKGRLLAGTEHAPRRGVGERPAPTPAEIHRHLELLNAAVPDLAVTTEDIIHVYAGYLPVGEHAHQLKKNDRIVHHANRGGLQGLYSVRSTKFTASHRTASRVLSKLFPGRRVRPVGPGAFEQNQVEESPSRGVWPYTWFPEDEDEAWIGALGRTVEEEAVQHLDDLILRRTSLGDNPTRALRVAPRLCCLFDWNEEQGRREVERVADHFQWLQGSITENRDP